MLSISFDRHKRPDMKSFGEYHKLVNRIHKLTDTLIGCNLLIDKELFKNEGKPFLKLIVMMFEIIKVDRVFALSPKNIPCPDIRKFKNLYLGLTAKYEKFYVDDLTKCILEMGYNNWGSSCHYGKELVSISEKGIVTGCSFDDASKGLLKLELPSDLLKLKDIKIKKRYSCPFLIEPQNRKV